MDSKNFCTNYFWSWELQLNRLVTFRVLNQSFWNPPEGVSGGVLTGWWFTGMLKGFFLIIGILMGGFPFKTQCAQFVKLGVFRKIRPTKHPICSNLGVFCSKWYSDWSQNHAFWGIEMVEILKSTLSLPVQNFWRTYISLTVWPPSFLGQYIV